ncbi:MAG: septum site-determining protein MinC [Lachnospiraceae bacterium]|nr:septum site-determining protein MinC [Lachnospiraceae bacterium]
MNSNVIIKSLQNGIKIILSPDCPFDVITKEVAEKFKESAGFFKGGKICVSFSGRSLSELEENMLIDLIEVNGQLTILYVISETEGENTAIAKALSKLKIDDEDTKGFGTVYKGDIHNGEHLKFDCGVVILGEIQPGGLISAKGNVIVLGGLYGSINIETNKENELYFISALEFSPERIRIDDARYYSKDKPKWSIKPKYQAKIAYYKDGEITVKEISPMNLKEIADISHV